MLILRPFIFLLFLTTLIGKAQGKFNITNGRGIETIPFTLINNLVIIPIDINNQEYTFLLDTGMTNTLLVNVEILDSTRLKNIEEVSIRGLGEGSALKAYKSKNNLISIKDDIVGVNQTIHLIQDEHFDLSAKMGINVQGIIGYELFKDFVIKTNYASKKLTVYESESYKYDKCNNCAVFPLEFMKNKPYIKVDVENHLGEPLEVKLLIDSGAGDALWLFENTHEKIKSPINYFDDFLGKGLSGNIFGKRSLINKLKIGDFEFKNATVSYPDSTSIITIHDKENRNGTLGAEILKRFHVTFDYSNEKILLKKNGFYYNAPFVYNKSGIEVVYDGDELVKEKTSRFVDYELRESQNSAITEVMATYYLTFKPSYRIANIRPNSPAHLAGLQKGDKLVEINNKPAYTKTLSEIVKLFSGKANKKIRLTISRNDKKLKYEFYLKDLL